MNAFFVLVSESHEWIQHCQKKTNVPGDDYGGRRRQLRLYPIVVETGAIRGEVDSYREETADVDDHVKHEREVCSAATAPRVRASSPLVLHRSPTAAGARFRIALKLHPSLPPDTLLFIESLIGPSLSIGSTPSCSRAAPSAPHSTSLTPSVRLPVTLQNVLPNGHDLDATEKKPMGLSSIAQAMSRVARAALLAIA